jgi:hypothetical protein
MAFSFERKILKSSDLQEQVRINDIIMSCHLFSSEKKNNNDNRNPTAFPAEETQAFYFSSGPFSCYQICPWKKTAQRLGLGVWVRNCVPSKAIRRGRPKETPWLSPCKLARRETDEELDWGQISDFPDKP